MGCFAKDNQFLPISIIIPPVLRVSVTCPHQNQICHGEKGEGKKEKSNTQNLRLKLLCAEGGKGNLTDWGLNSDFETCLVCISFDTFPKQAFCLVATLFKKNNDWEKNLKVVLWLYFLYLIKM